MRPIRIGALTLAVILSLAAWPQSSAPPPVDHSQHQVLNTPIDLPIPSAVVHLQADGVDGYNLFLETRNYRFTPENVGADPVANEGHAHLYVNGQKVARLYSPWRHLPQSLFQEGINRLQVELNANDHSIWGIVGEPIGADVLVDTRDQDGDPIVREAVRYTLDWTWGKAKRHPEGGWTLVKDLGYEIHVTGGKVVARSLELIPCHKIPPAVAWLAPAVARAGHSSLVANESRITTSYEEDLAQPAPQPIETRTVTDPEYCQAHYVVARPKGTGLGAPALAISGTWRRSGDRETPFAIESASAYGEIKDLPRTSILGGLDVRIVRPLDSILDGIDFAAEDSERIGSQIMRSLVSNTKIEIHPLKQQSPAGNGGVRR